MPPSMGESTQEMAILPISCHFTKAKGLPCPPDNCQPSNTELPTMPPMMACVVETGSPFLVANSSHNAAANSADIIIRIKSKGCIGSVVKSTMPVRMVSVTSPPAITAPLTSNTAAISKACGTVSVPAPTDVPNELATSLPPMLNAINTPNSVASKNRGTW